jgi:hypothetical protein
MIAALQAMDFDPGGVVRLTGYVWGCFAEACRGYDGSFFEQINIFRNQPKAYPVGRMLRAPPNRGSPDAEQGVKGVYPWNGSQSEHNKQQAAHKAPGSAHLVGILF